MQAQRTYADAATYDWFKISNEQARKFVGNKYFQLLKLITPHMHKTDHDLIDKILFAIINHKDLGIKDAGNDIYEAKTSIFRYFAIRLFNSWNYRYENNWIGTIDFPNDYPGSSTDPDRTRIMNSTMVAIQKLLAKAKVSGFDEWKAKWDDRDAKRCLAERERSNFIHESIYKFFTQLDDSYLRKLARKELYASYKTFCSVNGFVADSAISFGMKFYPHIQSASSKKIYIYGTNDKGKRTVSEACILSKEGIKAFLEHMDPKPQGTDTLSDFDDGYMSDYSGEPIIGFETRPMRYEETIEYFYQENPGVVLTPIEQPEQPIEPIEPIEHPIEVIEQPIEQPIEQVMQHVELMSDDDGSDDAREVASNGDIECVNDSDDDSDDEDAYASDDDFYSLSTRRTYTTVATQVATASTDSTYDSDDDSDYDDGLDDDDDIFKPIDHTKLREFAIAQRERERVEFMASLSKEPEYDVHLISEAKRELRA